nr:alpha/beta fold hydrolase [Aldersonia kunmingensis]
MVGGEALRPDLARRWSRGRTMVNAYGPTETTIVTTMSDPLGDGPVTIGVPIRGVAAVVLDERLRPVPIGATGELYFAGPELARGYYRRPAATASRFVADPFGGPASLMYRSGDLVRLRADGDIEYIGRRDHQVKIRGFRIELAEIDSVLGLHPSVDTAVTVAATAPGGDTALVAYVRTVPGAAMSKGELRAHVAANLPRHMVPAVFQELDEIPLTPVGKRDRDALPEPEFTSTSEFEPPRTPIEAGICEAFARQLGVARVGRDDSFFELGGNSLAATKLVAELRTAPEIGVPDLSAQWLFADVTPAALAQRCVMAREGGSIGDPSVEVLGEVLTIRAGGSGTPLFCVHPAMGLSWSYAGLLPALDRDRPVYGLQAPALSGAADMPDSVAELACRYVDTIRSVYPDGPYHLLGWSIGGLIAQEMAGLLVADGQRVASLTMLDSYVVSQRPSDFAAAPSVAELVAEFVGSDEVSANGADMTIEEAAPLVAAAGGALGTLTIDDLHLMYETYLRSTELARTFAPTRYPGEVLFFTAAEGRPEDPPAITDWANHLTGEVHEDAVSCTHAEMASPEALAHIGKRLNDHLRNADWQHQLAIRSIPGGDS